MIKQNDPLANYFSLKAEIDGAIERVLSSGNYVLGRETRGFEREFAQYLKGDYCVGVASGTDALFLTLKACGVGAGDDVITVSHTATATIASIRMCGARPIMVDIAEDTYTINPDQAERALTRHTKAIVPVHLYGQPADLDPLLVLAQRNRVSLIEDCAQAHGAAYRGEKVGTIGHAGAFSFYPTKNLGCIGDGGAVVTKDKRLYERLLRLRQYGWDDHRVCATEGYNSRLDELQAAVLRVKLKHLDTNNERRVQIAQTYNGLLKDLPLILPKEIPGTCHVYHQYVIGCPTNSTREKLFAFLQANGIQCGIHYPVPVHQHPAYSNASRRGLPITEEVAKKIISLPMYPELHIDQVEKVASTIRRFFQ